MEEGLFTWQTHGSFCVIHMASTVHDSGYEPQAASER